MLLTILKHFKKETKGVAIVEFVLLLALMATILAFLLPQSREFIIDKAHYVVDNVMDNDTSERAVVSLPNYDDMIGVSIQMTPSSNITPNTPVAFSATATGGKGPYYFEWTNYNGNSDGKLGDPNFFATGMHTVSIKITDDTGSIQNFSKSFEVKSVPATLNVSDTTPTVGDSIVASVAATGSVQCQFLAPQNSSNCTVIIPVVNDTPFDIAVDVCKDGLCETLKETINPKYEALTFDGVVGTYPEDMYESDFAQFKAMASGGSGNLVIEWQNYAGLDKPNVNGPQQKYAEGNHTVHARVCEAGTSNCTDWVGHAFTVQPDMAETVPLITWLNQTEVYTAPSSFGALLRAADIGCIGYTGNCVFGSIEMVEGPFTESSEDPTNEWVEYEHPGENTTETYVYNIEICDDNGCQDNEFIVYVTENGNPMDN